MKTGWVWHERFGWHDTGTAAGFLKGEFLQPLQHLESAESKARFASLVEVSGISEALERIAIEPASDEDLLRVHSASHVEKMREASGDIRGGDMGDGVSPFGFKGFELGKLAAGGTISAMRAVLKGDVQNAYALVRPPGHHARPDTGMGFCMFANIAVAIEYARAHLGLKQVAVVDWDVHHGNGTEACFEKDPAVLTISLHQDGNFPADTGKVEMRGKGEGEGASINIPLPAGSGEGAYLDAMERIVAPAIRRHQPELIIVASGFDSSNADPLGRMLLMSHSYRKMTRQLMDLAKEICDDRLLVSHEGGYSPFYVPLCGLAVVETLSGIDTGVVDPYAEMWKDLPGQSLLSHQQAVIDAVIKTHNL